jgi:YgiT-type zinc finger domain-containing protein
MCKGELEDKEVSYMVEIDKSIIIVKNVPAQVCKQCGEVSYSDEVTKKLEEMINSVKDSVTEVTIINYAI